MSNIEMINYLKSIGAIKSKKVEEAFRAVDRALFTQRNYNGSAYMDYPIPIIDGQTISAPSIVAIMLELLELDEGHKVLEIGSGSGYNTVLLSYLVGEKGLVVSIEYLNSLYEIAKENISKFSFCKNVKLINGDGSEGYPPNAPYDRIIVTAAMPYLKNHPLVKQLKKNGILVAPVGNRYWQDLVVYKNNEEIHVLPVAFVPLRGKYGWQDF
ncbi:MAG: protein-L-isoaspartate(D-aspartate) O-methyltransferase [Candidatus Bilamarchaeaceae archaeon]